MVVVGLERVERSLEMSAYLYERRLELVCHPLCHDLAPVLGHQDYVGMQTVDHVPPVPPLVCHTIRFLVTSTA